MKPFLVVDCAAAGAQLIEDKLFGHERGAFAGAHAAQPGVFEEARGGTVFLDEISELPVALQVKLLTVLERREATRIGASDPIKLDVWVVAATHRSPTETAQRGELREDRDHGHAQPAPTRELKLPAKAPEALTPSDAFDLPLSEATESFRKQYVAQLRQRFGSDLNAAAQHAGVHPKSLSRLFQLYDG